jgi:protein O-GlcNAc transferase
VASLQQRFVQAVQLHQAGKLAAAVQAYQGLLNESGAEPALKLSVLANLASALRAGGDLPGALRCYEQATAAGGSGPTAAQLWFNYGNALRAAGRDPDAEHAFRRALGIQADMFQAHFNLGKLLHDARRLEEAEPLYRAAIRFKPDFAVAHMNLGNLLRATGRLDESLNHQRRSAALAANDPSVQFNLGNALAAAGRTEDAAKTYEKAYQLAQASHNMTPQIMGQWASVLVHRGADDDARAVYERGLRHEATASAARTGLLRMQWRTDREAGLAAVEAALQEHGEDPELWRLLGQFRYDREEYADALAAFRKVLELAPGDADAHNSAGVCLQATGDWAGARAAFERAVELDPYHATALGNLGELHRQQKNHEQGIKFLRRAAEIDPYAPSSNANLATALGEVGMVAEAETVVRRILERDPEAAAGYNALGWNLVSQGKVREGIEACRKAFDLAPTKHGSLSSGLFATLYDNTLSPEQVRARFKEWGAEVPPEPAEAKLAERPSREGRRLRLGYVSPDFRAHPVAFFIEPVLKHHDRERIEVFCYSDVRAADETTERLRGLAEHWRDTSAMSSAELHAQIQKDQIDVLVDLAGHTAGNRAPLFAARAAPVQGVYLGFPYGTGVPEMDFCIGDAVATPPECIDLSPDRVAALECCFFCFRPHPEALDIAEPPVLKNGYVTFGCFNNLAKVSDTAVRLWAQAMQAVPKSRMIMRALALNDTGVRERYWKLFEAEGIDRRRVELSAALRPLAKFLGDYKRVDICLDPVPFNGGTTSVESLWQGVPLLSLAGKLQPGRMGASILTEIGLQDLVAESPEDFPKLTAALAGDVDRLKTLRTEIRERMQSSHLCGPERYTPKFEQLLLGL